MAEEEKEVQPVAETEESTEATETSTESEGTEKEGEEKTNEQQPAETEEKKNHFHRRQERLLRERAEYKARAEFLQQQIDRQNAQPAKNEGRPARDQYESDEDYVDALTDWKVTQKLTGVEEKLAKRQEQTRNQVEWASKITTARQEYADYDDVMELAQDIPITPAVSDAIQSSQFGADIAYYLAKNPDDAFRINSLPPVAAAREIGRIESYVEYEKNQKTQKKVPPVSKAPAPIKPVKASGAAGKSLEDMTPAEYIAYRNKQMVKR